MLMQAAIILVVVTPFSFDLHLGGVLVGMVMLAAVQRRRRRAVASRWRWSPRTRSGCSGRCSRR